jgi:hypothetical protein
MKSIDEMRTAISRRLANTWQDDIAGITCSWPHGFSVGQVSSTELEGDFGAVAR